MSNNKKIAVLPQVFSGNILFKELLLEHLRHLPESSSFQALSLFLDVPWGFAAATFPHIESSHSIILTNNLCPEYLEDLWDLKPTVLVAKQLGLNQLEEYLEYARDGQSVKLVPNYNLALTKSERKVLRLAAEGEKVGEIAKALYLSEGTVRNALSTIYDKLELEHKSDLTLYYFGNYVEQFTVPQMN